MRDSLVSLRRSAAGGLRGLGVVQAIRAVVNPDKLRHIGPVSDVARLAEKELPQHGHGLRPPLPGYVSAATGTRRPSDVEAVLSAADRGQEPLDVLR